MSHFACHIAHVTCHMSNAYVDSWDMLNNFCFHVYAQKWVFVIMSHVTGRMWHVTCHMSYVRCLCWSLGHAEQFLFSCLCSNVAVYGCKCQWVFFDTTLTRDNTNHRAGSQLKSQNPAKYLPVNVVLEEESHQQGSQDDQTRWEGGKAGSSGMFLVRARLGGRRSRGRSRFRSLRIFQKVEK